MSKKEKYTFIKITTNKTNYIKKYNKTECAQTHQQT